jgi:GTP-binding protein
MKILSAAFVKSGTAPKHYPPTDFPEVAFAGRSNVGKSSLINVLVNRKSLAKTSNTPGRTQALNFFVVNEKWYFTDLPGYGYAKVPEAVKRFWGPMVETYLKERRNLRLVLLILDIRRDPSSDDLSLRDWLTAYDISCLPVITKADKLSRGQATVRQHEICRLLGFEAAASVLFSAKTGEGRDMIWKAIREERDVTMS